MRSWVEPSGNNSRVDSMALLFMSAAPCGAVIGVLSIMDCGKPKLSLPSPEGFQLDLRESF